MLRSAIILSLLLFDLVPCHTQIPVGHWRDHLPYSRVEILEESDNKIYCSVGSAMFTYDKNGNNLEKISRVNGLSDMNISSIGYSDIYKLLLVGYENGNIDLLEGNQVFNIADLKRYSQFTGLKNINHVLFVENYAYLSCGFGIVVIDIEKREVKDTYIIGDFGAQLAVNGLYFDGTYLYAATKKGILRAERDNPNLVYYASWVRDTQTPVPAGNYSGVLSFSDDLWVVLATGEENFVYHYNGISWNLFETFSSDDPTKIRLWDQGMMIIAEEDLRIYDQNLSLVEEVNEYDFGTTQIRDALVDMEGNLRLADNIYGLVTQKTDGSFTSQAPNGPFTDDVSNIASVDEHVYVAGGGRDNSYTGIFNIGIVNRFNNNRWSSKLDYSVRDVVRILIDPSDPLHYYAASWGFGLLEFRDRELIEMYDVTNSTLETIIPGEPFVRIDGLALDRNDRLWMTNSGVPTSVSVKTADDWVGLPYNMGATLIGEILISRYGHKWVLLPKGNGIFAFDDMGTLDEMNDDLTRKFSLFDENGKTITSEVFSIAEDLDGNIWVGTNNGPIVYYSPQNVFGGDNFYAVQVKIPSEVEGQANYLLETENVTAIAIDGANRKWFGTASSGAYLFSEGGTEEIYHFTEENSPLLSNNINSISIEPGSGEVFFGTSRGVISFRSTATKGKSYFGKVYAFPNPVRENYTGPITITGLIPNTNVKITDVAGNIVYETESLGGQAIWDGRNFNGKRVQTGVYLIFCTNEDGSQTAVTKLLFIH